jgi:hAT family C-terminal dimerisation region
LKYVRSNSRSALLDLEEDDDSQMQTNMNELVSYCLGNMESDGIDILGYWKRNETAYPTLAMMTRDIFTVLVSTVSSESCFSSANRILTDKRSRFGAKTFERLVCLKDLFDAEQRNQHAPVEQSSGEFMTEADGDSDGMSENELWYMNSNGIFKQLYSFFFSYF